MASETKKGCSRSLAPALAKPPLHPLDSIGLILYQKDVIYERGSWR